VVGSKKPKANEPGAAMTFVNADFIAKFTVQYYIPFSLARTLTREE
jgi:hypothetical protein